EHDAVRRQDGQSGIVARDDERQYPVGPGVFRGEGDRGFIAVVAVGDVELGPAGERRELAGPRPGAGPPADAHAGAPSARRRHAARRAAAAAYGSAPLGASGRMRWTILWGSRAA